MNKLTNDNLLKEFFKKMQDKYPEITIEQAKDICHGPWRFLKREMESGELSEVRFKYFGTFQVYKGRAKNLLSKLDSQFQNKIIPEKEYLRIKPMLEKFLSNEEKI